MGGSSYMYLRWTFAGVCRTLARGMLCFYQEFQGSLTVFRGLVKQGGSLCPPGTGLACCLEIGGIVSLILQTEKVRLREAKSGVHAGMWEGRAGVRIRQLMALDGAQDWAETSKGQVIAADILPSPWPWPLALSLTFNQVPVMSGPAVGAGPPQLLHDKWFSFEREVIKTRAQGHCQGTED